MKHLEVIVHNCIEYCEQKDLGMFIFNNEKGRGFVHNILNHKTYSVGDFVDMVFHEKMKDKLKENLKGGK
jgi:hypothetical protein